jgi:hypothetical protein
MDSLDHEVQFETLETVPVVKTAKLVSSFAVVELETWPHQRTQNYVFFLIVLDQVPASFGLVVVQGLEEEGVEGRCWQVKVRLFLLVLDVTEVHVV